MGLNATDYLLGREYMGRIPVKCCLPSIGAMISASGSSGSTVVHARMYVGRHL